ncbi:hypothetical protein Plim_3557 [Planctopirus limnophila DSM 3776]|uniref:Uncharacterized protein n=1 Tax=Planctopirus limnophila (strain ATCC 43296 / DSM 3776 / IFAM 1008 / Mu 290) TaxID=521674 RepID=D5SVL0_PLAL2|nr:hypothetical protein [Planctopirus limnophila]ADG69370.1 hypothetical protein Plim_3557 [Planctopirus limnophila DSM 3776]
MYSESLTLRILADSSELESRLGDLGRQLSSLQSSTDRLSSSASRLTGAFQMTSAMNSVERLSRSLQALQRQVQQISGTPLNLNVSPALAAIASVSRALSQLARQVSTFPSMTGSGYLPLGTGSFLPTGTGSSYGGGSTTNTRRFATGGLVTGPPGIDRIPALLTAGEYVLSSEVVQRLGLGNLSQLSAAASGSSRAIAPPATVQNSHHQSIGELHVHMAQTLDLASFTENLAADAQRLRHRRG